MPSYRPFFQASHGWPAAALVLLTALPGLRGDELQRDVSRWIAGLGSPEFLIRQEATAALERLGDEAIPQLCRAAQSSDAEVRSRALAVLIERALSSPGDSRWRARDALSQLSTLPQPRIRAFAEAAITQVQETTAGLAVAELTRLGATLMPVYGASRLTFNAQIGQGWKGTNDQLALLSDLKDVPWLSFESSSIDDEALHQVAGLSRQKGGPTRLFLGNSKVRGTSLAALAPLTRVEYLSLKQLPVGNSQIASLPDFPALQYLGLDGTRITDDGLESLRRYKKLQVLWLDNTEITDGGISSLASLEALRTLYLPATQVHGSGLAALQKLPGLTSLSLKGNKLSPECLKEIRQLEQLESLGLDLTDVADWQLADLAGLARLRILWLTGTQISDEGLVHLRSLAGLQILHLGDTNVTKEGAAALQLALPKCQITMNSLPKDNRPTNAAPALKPAAPAGAGS